MLNSESESCYYDLTSKIGITESSDKLFLADTRLTRIIVGFRRQYTSPSIFANYILTWVNLKIKEH